MCKHLLFFLICVYTSLSAQPERIFMDGFFEDWDGLEPQHVDPAGDHQGGEVDFTNLWISNDADYLFIRISLGADINMQSGNQIRLYLDTDNALATGVQVNGIGAELTWIFGDRDGTFYHSGGSTAIFQDDLGIVTSPTYSSTEFEIALPLNAEPLADQLLFPVEDIRMAFVDGTADLDEMPNALGGVEYSIAEPFPPAVGGIALRQHPDADLRIMSYNVLFNGLFDLSLRAQFSRIFQAINPQIIGFEEIYNFDAPETAAVMETILPSGPGEAWYAAKEGSDVLAVSRYPIIASAPIEAYFTNDYNGAFLIDLSPAVDSELLFIVAHTPCCDEDDGRQFDVDAMMAFVRDAQNGVGPIVISPQTPIVICGDMNLVGSSQQHTTLLTGEIVNEGLFGPSFDPDWDGTELRDLLPGAPNLPMFFTWYDEGSSFSPGRLDFLIYSNSVMESLRQYVLFTPGLPADTLTAYNLLTNDAVQASDHLPVVGDFDIQSSTSLDDDILNVPQTTVLEQNYPNPFNPATTIRYVLPQAASINLVIYDIDGRQVRQLTANSWQPAGRFEVSWNGTDDAGRPAASGVYFYRLKTYNRLSGGGVNRGSKPGSYSETRKMVLLR